MPRGCATGSRDWIESCRKSKMPSCSTERFRYSGGTVSSAPLRRLREQVYLVAAAGFFAAFRAAFRLSEVGCRFSS